MKVIFLFVFRLIFRVVLVLVGLIFIGCRRKKQQDRNERRSYFIQFLVSVFCQLFCWSFGCRFLFSVYRQFVIISSLFFRVFFFMFYEVIVCVAYVLLDKFFLIDFIMYGFSIVYVNKKYYFILICFVYGYINFLVFIDICFYLQF